MKALRFLEFFVVGISALCLLIALAGNPSNASKNDVDFAASMWRRDLDATSRVSLTLLKRIQRLEKKLGAHVPFSQKIVVGSEAL